MKKVISITILLIAVFANVSAMEKPHWTNKKIPTEFEEVESRHTMTIRTLANTYNCSVIYYEDGDTEIFTYDNYYRRNSVMEHIYISKGEIVLHTVAAFSNKGKIIKYGPTYPVFKEKFLKEIHGLPWKIRKEISNAFPPPQKK